MIAERPSKHEIFNAAAELPDDAERRAFLDKACGSDTRLRAEIENLLQRDQKAGSFLESPPPGIEVTTGQLPAERPGTLIGPYKLLEQIGEGGMGVVYVAEQTEPVRRRVALKIIKPGMDTKQVIARFEAERQALAMMDHPHIAKVLDAGTTEAGRPYFVMELVRGMPFTDYCDKVRLSPRQRLELFVDVCHAIQHAHQKGIIHRDLKPSNILITLHDGKPVVKVIDFGVAKAIGQQLTERTVYTALTQLVGTPLYMSPEQAELSGLDIDTRSDVYSLGVLLYELLTGQTPFDKDRLKSVSFDEMRRMIREDEPQRPSRRFSTLGAAAISTAAQHRGVDERRLSRILSGELDWIVMKALEKDRSRRYESASALATDIQRYLSDEPVLACPPTTMYRFQKFARKHKPALATAAAIALCLLLGTTVSAWQAVRATTAEAQANANAAQAQAKTKEATEQRDEAQRQRDEVKALNEQIRRTSYAANLVLAKHAWDEAVIPRAIELLELSRPKAGQEDLRGFEWHYLYRLCHSELFSLKGGNEVSYSPDGKRLAVSGRGGMVTMYDAQTGQELKSFNLQSRDVIFSPNGEWLAGQGPEGTVRLWDSETGTEKRVFRGHKSSIWGIAFSPDGSRLASVSTSWDEQKGFSPGETKIWSTATGEELLSFAGGGANVAFSPDGKRLATTTGHEVINLWDSVSGQKLLTFNCGGTWSEQLVFSPDGQRLAVASDRDGEGWTVTIWDAQKGEELVVLKDYSGQIDSISFSPDGKWIAAGGGERSVKVWDAATGDELFAFKGHTNLIQSIAFSPDGKRLASAALGTVKVWDTTIISGPAIEENGSVRSVAVSPDGNRLALGSGTWDNAEQKFLARFLRIVDRRTGKEIVRMQPGDRAARHMAFSADGKRLATSENKTIKLWDAETGRELLSLEGNAKGVSWLVFCPHSNHLLSAGNDMTVKVWNSENAQELLTFKGHATDGRASDVSAVNGLAVSPDGKRAASSSRNATKIWNIDTGEELLSLPGTAHYAGLAFSPDGNRLACSRNVAPGGVGDVFIVDSRTGNEFLCLKGHTASVSSVQFSPDGKRLASASGNPTDQKGELKVWDAETGQELLSLKGGFYGHRAAFTPDGHRLLSWTGGMLKIYDATPLPEKP